MPLDRDLQSKNLPVFPSEPMLGLLDVTGEIFDFTGAEIFWIAAVLVALFYVAWFAVRGIAAVIDALF